MNKVSEHYEAYPYPERRPADERKRLITGSPSHPLEMDHFLWGGKRDWSQPLRALVAGGGTGDAAPLLAGIDGRKPLAALTSAARLDPFAFNALWRPAERRLVEAGILLYSRLLA
ncbi:hypothetical protein [Albidovulum sp.]|uniref:hypothetical protein n=1 Tax=Albidovulum sp. TaxID=1872424 RepID=UPI003D7E0CE7